MRAVRKDRALKVTLACGATIVVASLVHYFSVRSNEVEYIPAPDTQRSVRASGGKQSADAQMLTTMSPSTLRSDGKEVPVAECADSKPYAANFAGSQILERVVTASKGATLAVTCRSKQWWAREKRAWLLGGENPGNRAWRSLQSEELGEVQRLFLADVIADSLESGPAAELVAWLQMRSPAERGPMSKYLAEHLVRAGPGVMRNLADIALQDLGDPAVPNNKWPIGTLEVLAPFDDRCGQALLHTVLSAPPIPDGVPLGKESTAERALRSIGALPPAIMTLLLEQILSNLPPDDLRWNRALVSLAQAEWRNTLHIRTVMANIERGESTDPGDIAVLGRTLQALQAGRIGSMDPEIATVAKRLQEALSDWSPRQSLPETLKGHLSDFERLLEVLVDRADVQQIRAIEDHLADAQPGWRRHAVAALGNRPYSSSAYGLLSKLALHSGDLGERISAIGALAQSYASADAVETLRSLASMGQPDEVRRASIDGLTSRYGRTRNPEERMRIVRAAIELARTESEVVIRGEIVSLLESAEEEEAKAALPTIRR